MDLYGVPGCRLSRGEEATIMSTRLHGRLDEQDYSDTYTLWRRPGRWRYELIVRGEGAVGLRLEAVDAGGNGDPGSQGGWRVIEDRPAVPGGSRLDGSVTVPEVDLGPSAKVGWAQLRLRIFRATASRAVEYEFSLDGGT